MRARLLATYAAALRLLRVRFVAEQIGLAVVVSALGLVWLRLPDGSWLELAATVLLGLVGLGVAGGGEAWLLLGVAGEGRARARVVRGGLLVLGGAALWVLWVVLLVYVQGSSKMFHGELVAGWVSSKLPHGLRHGLTYERVFALLGWLGALVQWVGDGVLVAVTVAAVVSGRAADAAVRVVRSVEYWVALLVGAVVATWLTEFLMGWTPGHGVGVEMVSLVLRMAGVVGVDAVIVSAVLAVVVGLVRVNGAGYSMAGGTPEASQERTVERP